MSELPLSRRRRHLWAIFPMPPPTIDTGRWVTVTYPTSLGTVLSVHSAGTTTLKPTGSQGPGELAVLLPDRVAYAPRGRDGAAFLLPYCAAVPTL